MKQPFDLSLYLVLDPQLCGDYGMIETTRDAIKGGATMIQLRMKNASTQERIDIGRALKELTTPSSTTLIINDDVEAAIAINADGVHIGQSDGGAAHVRTLIGPEKIIGLSVAPMQIAKNAEKPPVDYIGVGPVFATSTKPDHNSPIGFNGLKAIVEQAEIPTVAIGGLKLKHVASTFSAGVDGIAIVSAICGQPNPYQATLELHHAIEKAKQ